MPFYCGGQSSCTLAPIILVTGINTSLAWWSLDSIWGRMFVHTPGCHEAEWHLVFCNWHLFMANAGYHLSCRESAYSHSLKNDLGPSSDHLQSPCFAMLTCSTGVIALCLQDASHLLLHQLHVVQSINLTLCKCLYI